jgi:hypothetical protein
MEKQWLTDNDRELARLKKLVDEISDEELQLVIYKEGWTIAVMLAHLAYWDLWSVLLMRKWKTSGKVKPIPVDWDTFNDELMPNDTILPFLLAIPPRTAANMAVGWAEALNHELDETTPEMIAEIERLGDETRLYRSIHRKMHLDEIEALLKSKRGNN